MDWHCVSLFRERTNRPVMPRRKRCRRVRCTPPVTVYKPAGIPARELEEILLTVDEFEAIRLADFEGLDQREASEMMDVSQPTFNRILASARNKIAAALVRGAALRMEGGHYVVEPIEEQDPDNTVQEPSM